MNGDIDKGKAMTADFVYWLFTGMGWLAGLVFLLLGVMFVRDLTQTHSSVRRNFPLVGRMRYFLEG
ncbi:hypothetical protein QQ73_15985, partial [Candidatus Endoriftia persephone str. Guaymas]|nr:hypothetical protein [Candidatus Endoriftia persephone str. Guaymas]